MMKILLCDVYLASYWDIITRIWSCQPAAFPAFESPPAKTHPPSLYGHRGLTDPSWPLPSHAWGHCFALYLNRPSIGAFMSYFSLSWNDRNSEFWHNVATGFEIVVSKFELKIWNTLQTIKFFVKSVFYYFAYNFEWTQSTDKSSDNFMCFLQVKCEGILLLYNGILSWYTGIVSWYLFIIYSFTCWT